MCKWPAWFQWKILALVQSWRWRAVRRHRHLDYSGLLVEKVGATTARDVREAVQSGVQRHTGVMWWWRPVMEAADIRLSMWRALRKYTSYNELEQRK